MTSLNHHKLGGFRAGAWSRLAMAGIYLLLALAATLWVESKSTAAPAAGQASAPPAPRTSIQRIELTSAQPIASWTVRLDGKDLPPRTLTATKWLATEVKNEGTELLIEANGEDLLSSTPNALRIIVETPERRIDRTVWSAGIVSDFVRLAEARP